MSRVGYLCRAHCPRDLRTRQPLRLSADASAGERCEVLGEMNRRSFVVPQPPFVPSLVRENARVQLRAVTPPCHIQHLSEPINRRLSKWSESNGIVKNCWAKIKFRLQIVQRNIKLNRANWITTTRSRIELDPVQLTGLNVRCISQSWAGMSAPHWVGLGWV